MSESLIAASRTLPLTPVTYLLFITREGIGVAYTGRERDRETEKKRERREKRETKARVYIRYIHFRSLNAAVSISHTRTLPHYTLSHGITSLRSPHGTWRR